MTADHPTVALVTPPDAGTIPGSITDDLRYRLSSGDRVLVVTYSDPPDRIHDAFADADTPPADLGVITANDGIRSSSAVAGNGAIDTASIPTRVETVPPANLTRLGVRITEFLKRWETDEGRIILGFDSITLLAQQVDSSTLLRFLHVLAGHLRAVEASGYFAIDPAALDDTSVAQAKSVVDTVVAARQADGSKPTLETINE